LIKWYTSSGTVIGGVRKTNSIPTKAAIQKK